MRKLWFVLAAITAAGVFISWWQTHATGLAWWHIAGLALSVVFLALIWLWPGSRQPTQPPP